MKVPYLSVVIPAYNEEQNIRRTLERLAYFLDRQGWDWEAIVVDDGSGDKTTEIVKGFSKKGTLVRLIEKPHRGKGFAVRTGVLEAKGEFILFSDADSAVGIEEIKRLFLWIREYDFDIAIGSREGVGAKRIEEPWYRHLMGRVFNFIVKLLVLRGIEDTQCGFKLFRGRAAKDIFSRLKLYGEEGEAIEEARVTAFDVEVLFLARKLGYKIKEVPVVWNYVKTKNINPLRDSWHNFWDVVKVRVNDLRGVYR